MATIAVFAVLVGGSAYAASKLGKNAVKSRNIAPGAVKTADIGKKAVKRAKIAPDAIDASRLAGSSVGTNKIVADAVTTGKLESGAVTGAKLAAGAVAEGNLSAALRGKVNGFQTGGIVRVAASGTKATTAAVPLLSRGPFTIYAKCWSSPAPRAQIFAATSEAGALMIGGGSSESNYTGSPPKGYLGPSTPEQFREVSIESAAISNSTAAFLVGSATLIRGATSIQVGVSGFVKGADVASDDGNYGTGGARCVFSPYLFAASG